MNEAQIEGGPPGWLPGFLEGAWTLLASYPLLLALLIVMVGITVALLARAFVVFWGLKLTHRIPGDLDDALLRLGAGVAALVLIYLSFVAAVQTLPISEGAATVLTRVLVSVLILQLMRVGFRATNLGLRFLSTFRERWAIIEERTIPLFDLVATLLIVAITGYALLQVWDFDPTPWLASAGVVGIAVGFAAKDTLANLFAGFFIIGDAPYRVGDYVLLDSGERGEITRVGIRSTRMLTRDDIEIVIPNAMMANQKIVNESTGRWIKTRMRLPVGVAYGSDVDRVVEILLGVARAHPTLSQDPEPQVRMQGFGDSSLDFELRCWVNHPSQRGLLTHELYMEIYKALGREEIEIPFPQRDLWVREVPETLAREASPEAEGPA
jgi:MscS family membrane protein